MSSSSHYYEDANILADVTHLQEEQPSKVGPGTTTKCVRRPIWGNPMLYADDGCFVSRSPRGFGRMMVSVEISRRRIWSGHLREQDGDHVHAESALCP